MELRFTFHCMTSNKILHIKASFMGLEKSISTYFTNNYEVEL
jgi:hypothetical protein